MLSDTGLCDKLIIRSEESYRLWCVVVCDLKTLRMRRSLPTAGCRSKQIKLAMKTRNIRMNLSLRRLHVIFLLWKSKL